MAWLVYICSESKIKHCGLNLNIKDTEKLTSKIYWQKFTDSKSCASQFEFLSLNQLKLSFGSVILYIIFPDKCPTQIIQITIPQLAL